MVLAASIPLHSSLHALRTFDSDYPSVSVKMTVNTGLLHASDLLQACASSARTRALTWPARYRRCVPSGKPVPLIVLEQAGCHVYELVQCADAHMDVRSEPPPSASPPLSGRMSSTASQR